MLLKILLYGVEIVTSFLLIIVILAQRSKGQGGLGGAAFGGAGESIFGSRAGNFLTKATVILGSIFMINTLGLTLLMSSEAASRAALASSVQIQAAPVVAPAPNGTTAPDAPVTTPQAPPAPPSIPLPTPEATSPSPAPATTPDLPDLPNP